MIKKILIAVVILGVIIIAFVGYGTYEVANDALKKQEPQLRQYLQMNETEKNKYIMDHVDEIIAKALVEAKSDEKTDIETFAKLREDPVIQEACIKLGRALLATAVIHSDAIVKDMENSIKEIYKKESEELSDRLKTFLNLIKQEKK